jgi:hypothetical protein
LRTRGGLVWLWNSGDNYEWDVISACFLIYFLFSSTKERQVSGIIVSVCLSP